MNKSKFIFIFALIITLMPFTGFTRTIKTVVYVVSGISIMFLASPTKINISILKSKKGIKFFEESSNNNKPFDGGHIA